MDILVFEFLGVVFFGLVLGSFATALIYRVPRDISWVKNDKKGSKPARSACPHCNHVLGFRDLVPVFSWVLSKGKCRYCAEKISVTYPLAELMTCLGAIGVYLVFGISVTSVMLVLALPFLIALFFIDFQTFRLPNQLVLIVGIMGLIELMASFFLMDGYTNIYEKPELMLYSRISAVFVYSGLLWFVGFVVSKALKKPSLGLGDVKFYAASGIWLGLAYLGDFMFLCGLLGIIWGIWYKSTFKSQHFPFGPALIAAFYAGMLLQGAGYSFLAYN